MEVHLPDDDVLSQRVRSRMLPEGLSPQTASRGVLVSEEETKGFLALPHIGALIEDLLLLEDKAVLPSADELRFGIAGCPSNPVET